jgi:hypothetical protein|tara:strand:- start:322 stop:462 length:141 start_codon:yes stop_codon:yes gene_type:complete
MNKTEIVLEIREIINDYQEIIPKDVEQALKNLADEIEGDVYGKRSQ